MKEIMGIKTNITYGNPVVRKSPRGKNEVRRLSGEYSNKDWHQVVDNILDTPLPDKKKGGEK